MLCPPATRLCVVRSEDSFANPGKRITTSLLSAALQVYPQSVDTTGVSFITRRDSLDWKGLSASEITRRVLDRVQPGSIVLFHNAAEHTPEALPEILDSLLADGYRVVPVSQILLQGDCFIDSTGRQCRR